MSGGLPIANRPPDVRVDCCWAWGRKVEKGLPGSGGGVAGEADRVALRQRSTELGGKAPAALLGRGGCARLKTQGSLAPRRFI